MLLITSLPAEVWTDILRFHCAKDLCSFAQCCRHGAESTLQPVLWQDLFYSQRWTSVATQAVRASLLQGLAEQAPLQMTERHIDFKALFRSALLRELGAVVVELGSEQHRIGQCFWTAPRLVPRRDVLDYTLPQLLSLPAEDGETLPAFLSAIAALVPSAASAAAILFLVPPYTAARHTLLVFAKRLLRAGCRRVRFESSAVCACYAHDVKTAVVLDVGWSRASAVAVVHQSMPTHMAAFGCEAATETGVYRRGGSEAVRRNLRSALGEDVEVDEEALDRFLREHCYVRLVSTVERPPSQNEIDLAAMNITDRLGNDHEMGEARFSATEGLFRTAASDGGGGDGGAAAAAASASEAPMPRQASPGRMEPSSDQPPNGEQRPLGLHDMIHRAISLAVPQGAFLPPELRQELYSNVIVTGGSSTFPGLDRRLRREMQRSLPASISSHIVSGQVDRGKRPIAAWQGGAQLARGDVDDEVPLLSAGSWALDGFDLGVESKEIGEPMRPTIGKGGIAVRPHRAVCEPPTMKMGTRHEAQHRRGGAIGRWIHEA